MRVASRNAATTIVPEEPLRAAPLPVDQPASHRANDSSSVTRLGTVDHTEVARKGHHTPTDSLDLVRRVVVGVR